MTAKDAMIIRPRLRPQAETSTRARAAEERQTDRVARRQRRAEARARRVRGARRAARRSTRTKRSASKNPSGGILKKAAWALTAAEALITAGKSKRRLEGASQRLTEAQDADTMWIENLDEKAVARRAARGFVESNRNFLRIIGREGKVNEQIFSLAEDVRRQAFTQAVNIDKLERDPRLDSPDTMQDLMIRALKDEARRQNLKEKLTEALRKAREFLQTHGGGR
jgi:hypothetical protein